MSRVEVLSDSDDEVPSKGPSQQQKSHTTAQSDSSRTPASLVGPPKPPEGVVLKRAGKKKSSGAKKVASAAESDRDQSKKSNATAVDDDDDDDPNDLPPPLEPLPFVAQKLASGQKLKEDASSIAPVKASEPTKLPPKDKQEATQDEAPKKPLIGPPKPTDEPKKKSSSSSSSDAKASSSSSRPAYLERDILEYPLFMNELPKEPSANPDIAALQAMAAEETPEERAENFKNSGNECLQNGGARWWDDAIEYYTRAIQCGSRDYPKVSVYFSNRAAVQILKKNWGHAARDCLEALELDPNNAKAMYRAAKSFYEVRKLPEALKYLKMAMAKAKNQQLLDLERDIARAMRKEALKEEKRKKEAEVALEAESEVASLIRERGYKFGYDDIYSAKERMSQFGSKVKIETSELPARRGGGGGGMISELCTPVVVVYPQSRQSDFVQSWGENLFVRDLLETLLKEHETSRPSDSWDRWGVYNTKEIGNMCVYVKTNDVFDTFEKQEWIQVKLSSTLGEAMKCHPNYIIPVVPVLFVFHNSFKKDFFSSEVQSMWGTPAKKVEED